MASKIKISELPALTGTVADSYNIPIDDGSTTYKVSVAHFEEAAAHTASEYAAAAAVSAEAAAGSAGEAATTATTIETDIGTATRLVNDARGYASSAADSVTAAQAASGAATTKANEALNSANAAAGSAGEAAASATTASNYVTNAQAEANRAKSWADYPNATGSSGDATHNAHYWADVAQAIAGGGVTSFNGRGGVVVPEAGDYSAAMISYDNTDSGLTATDAQAAIDEVNTDLNTLDTAVETLDTNKANASQLAAVEDGETSSAAYTAGDYISRNGVLYEVIAAIAIGDSFTVGTNIQATTVGDEVEAIKTDLSDIEDDMSEYHVVPSRNLCPFYTNVVGGFTYTPDENGYTSCSSASDTRSWSYSGSNILFRLPAGSYHFHVFTKTAYTSGYTGARLYDSANNLINGLANFDSDMGFDFTLAATTDLGLIYKLGNGSYAFMVSTAADWSVNNTYEPYYVCMRDGKLDITDYAVTGAVNLFKMVAQSTTQSPISSVIDIDAQTATLSATAAVSTTKWFSLSGSFKLPQGRYFLSGCPKMTGVTCQLLLRDNPQDTFVVQDYGNGGVWFDVDATIAAKNLIMYIGVSCTAAFSNLVFRPMIATNDKMPYAPFAMTNRELTENVLIQRVLTSSDNLNSITQSGMYYVQSSAPTNSPPNQTWYPLIVSRVADNNIHQMVYKSDLIYCRRYSGEPAAWGSWYKYIGTEV